MLYTPSRIYENLIKVDKPSDFGIPIDGVYTLKDNTAYYVLKRVDLNGLRIELGNNPTIYGHNANSCVLTSTGLVGALITGTKGCKVFDIGFESNTVFDLSGDSTAGLDWSDLNFINCTAGTIENYTNFIAQTFGFFNSDGFVFDGILETVGFASTIWTVGSGQTALSCPSSASIGRRLRIDTSAVIVASGGVGFNVDPSAFGNDETYILENVNFSGAGTYLVGLNHESNRSIFRDCVGIGNSANIAQYIMSGNAVATTIVTPDVYVKAAGATTSGIFVEKFDVTTTDNKAVYVGATQGHYEITATITLSSGNNKQIGCRIAKNGTSMSTSTIVTTTSGSGRSENITVQDVVELSPNDYIELFVTDTIATNAVTIIDLNLIIKRLN